MNTHDPVLKPVHYNSHKSGIEAIEITEHLSFNLGNAVKYLWRASLKNGKEDMRKAAWYIRREADLWTRRGNESIEGFSADHDALNLLDIAFEDALFRVIEHEPPTSLLHRLLDLIWTGWATDDLRTLARDAEALANVDPSTQGRP
jgi:hypothetical protein